MYYPRRTAYRKKAPYKKRAVKRNFKRRSTSKVSTATKSYVNRMIHKNIENKKYISSGANINIVSAQSSTPQYVLLTPTMSQSVANGGRIANEIIVRKAFIRGRINLLPYNATTNNYSCPTLVKMWVCRRKRSNITLAGLPQLTDWNNFFDTGAGASGFAGSPLDMFTANNTEYWDILRTKQITLSNAFGPLYSSGTINSSAGSVSVPFTFYFDRYLTKLKFNDTTTSPTNKELFLVFQAVYADGQSSTSQTQCEFHYSMTHIYEDA